jgi:hypothetical protein
VAYLLQARTVDTQKQPFLSNTRTQQWNSGAMQHDKAVNHEKLNLNFKGCKSSNSFTWSLLLIMMEFKILFYLIFAITYAEKYPKGSRSCHLWNGLNFGVVLEQ